MNNKPYLSSFLIHKYFQKNILYQCLKLEINYYTEMNLM